MPMTTRRRMRKMSKHFVSFEAKCPFYKEEDRNIIYCEGLTDSSRIHNAFSSDAAGYKEQFCCDRWEDCRIAKMLWAKYE